MRSLRNDLTLNRGGFAGAYRESGAGKSTLALGPWGLPNPVANYSGSIHFDGVDLATLSDEKKRSFWGNRMTYVAQSAAASFNPAHRLIEQTTSSTIRFGIRDRAAAYKDAHQLYESLNLPDSSNIGERYPHQVSGGQLQRIMTAMAMSPRPDLIIFDEPTTALDVTTQLRFFLPCVPLLKVQHRSNLYHP